MKRLLASILLTSVYLFAEASVEESVREAIKNEYYAEYPEIVITSVTIEDDSKIADQNRTYIGLEIQKQNLKKNIGVVTVVLSAEKNVKKRVFVRYRIEALLTISKAKYNLQKDKIIEENDILADTVEFKNFYAKPLTPKQALGLATNRFIAAGSVINTKDAKRPPLIKKGESGYAVINEGGLALESEVTALEDGNAGDSINVKVKNGKILKAILRQDGKMEIK